jgi:hypothetical protein
MPTASIKFRQDYGDHLAGALVQLPDGLARHLVDSGLATFVAAPEPVVEPDPVIERADAPKPKNVQRAAK